MAASIFNGDSVKILKDKLKFKSGDTVEKVNDSIVVTDTAGKVTKLDNLKSKSIFTSWNSDQDLASNWTNTGAGVFDILAGTDFGGNSIYRFTTSAQFDQIKRSISLDVRRKTIVEHSVTFHYSSSQVGMDVILYDVTNSKELERLSLPVVTSGYEKVIIPYTVRSTTSTLDLRFENVHNINTPLLYLNDIEFSDDPFVYKNLLETSSVRAEGSAGQAITANVTDVPFIEVSDSHNAWNGTQYTVQNSNSVVTFTGHYFTIGSINFINLYVNGIKKSRIGSTNTTSAKSNDNFSFISSKGYFNAGDVLSVRIDVNETLQTDPYVHYLNINEQWESEHVITPAKSNLNNYSARIANNGTASITSQDYDAISSVTRTSLGQVSVVFKAGLFTVTPSVTITQDDGGGGRTSSYANLTTTGATVLIATHTGALEDHNFSINISTQGADVQNATFLAAVPTSLFNTSSVGSSSIYKLLNAENGITDFINTGSGSLSKELASPISGSTSYKFISLAQNDKVTTTVTPDFRNKGKENSVSLQYTMDVLGGEAVIYDVATASELERVALTVSTTSQTLNIPFFLKDSATDIQFFIENTHLTNTPIITFDDVEFSDDPFTYKNLIKNESYRVNKLSSVGGSVNTAIFVFDNTNVIENNAFSLFKVVNSSTLGTYIEILSDCTITISSSITSIAPVYFGLTKNSTELTTGIQSLINQQDVLTVGLVPNGNADSISFSGSAKTGDIFRVHNNGTTSYAINDLKSTLAITAQAESEHVITPAKSNMTDWISYTPTFQGFGTPTNIDVKYKQVGDTYLIKGKFSAGAVTPVEAQISLPNGKTIKSGQLAESSGVFFRGGVSTNASNGGSVVSTGGDLFINLGSIDTFTNITVDPILPVNANSIANTGDIISINAVVQIEGLSSDATFLAAIPKKRIVKYSYSNAVNVASIVGTVTVPLDIVEGDTSFSSLSANQITLQAGKYKFTGGIRCFISGVTYGSVVDVNSSIELVKGATAFSSAGTSAPLAPIDSVLVTLNSVTTVELRNTSSTASVYGVAFGGDTANNIFNYLAIEKLY